MKKYSISIIAPERLRGVEMEIRARCPENAAERFRRAQKLRGKWIAETRLGRADYICGLWTRSRFGGLDNTGIKIFLSSIK